MADVTFAGPPPRDRDAVTSDTTYLGAMIKRTSWGAVVAGAVTAISLQMLFSVLGIALGTTTADLFPAEDAPQRVSIVAGLWWLITGTISLFIGGCVVGRFAGMVRSPDVLLHALVMWAVTAIFGFAVLSSAGIGLGNSLDSYADNHYSRGGGLRLPGNEASSNRVILTSDTAAGGTQGQSSGATADSQDVESVRRLARNTAWWSLVALMIGIGVSLGGAWTTAPHRIVVRPTTVHN